MGIVLTARQTAFGISPTVGSSIVATVLPLTLVSEIVENEEGAEDEQFVEATWVVECNDTDSLGLQLVLTQVFPALKFSFGEDYFGDLLPEH